MVRIIISLLLMSLLLNGCATLSKEECKRGDWASIGYGDGANGKPKALIQQHKKACAKHQIVIDENLYYQSRDKGLNDVFCKPRNAYRIGVSGGRYTNVCPASSEGDFLVAYRYGINIYDTQKTIDGLRITISHLQDQKRKLQQTVEYLQNTLHHYPRIPIRKIIARHIDEELNRIMDRLVHIAEAMEIEESMSAKEKHLLRSLMSFSARQGKLENRLDWVRTMEKMDHEIIQSLEERIAHISLKLQKQKRKLLKMRPGLMQEINRVVRLSSYSGVLESQLRMLHEMRARRDIKELVRYHFKKEPTRIREISDKSLLKRVNMKSRRELRQDLRNASRDYTRVDQEIVDVDFQLSQTLRMLDDLKHNNPYR